MAKIYYGMAPKASALFVSFSKWLLGIGSAIIVCGVGGYFLVHFDIVSSFSLGAYNYIYGLVASFGAGLILFTGGLIRAGQKVKSTF
ncbi:hypothetical protein KKH24_00435 [Patescibacteria group bacterium]|nr:hypothetical protein [Patescibacteria group bacterium]